MASLVSRDDQAELGDVTRRLRSSVYSADNRRFKRGRDVPRSSDLPTEDKFYGNIEADADECIIFGILSKRTTLRYSHDRFFLVRKKKPLELRWYDDYNCFLEAKGERRHYLRMLKVSDCGGLSFKIMGFDLKKKIVLKAKDVQSKEKWMGTLSYICRLEASVPTPMAGLKKQASSEFGRSMLLKAISDGPSSGAERRCEFDDSDISADEADSLDGPRLLYRPQTYPKYQRITGHSGHVVAGHQSTQERAEERITQPQNHDEVSAQKKSAKQPARYKKVPRPPSGLPCSVVCQKILDDLNSAITSETFGAAIKRAIARVEDADRDSKITPASIQNTSFSEKMRSLLKKPVKDLIGLRDAFPSIWQGEVPELYDKLYSLLVKADMIRNFQSELYLSSEEEEEEEKDREIMGRSIKRLDHYRAKAAW